MFAITQVVSLVVHDLTLAGMLRGALLLALMWWAWTNWTWTTNVVDLEPRVIRVAVLVSMLGVFGMAFAVPTAFEGNGDWLAFGYVLVRVVAAVVFVIGTRHDPEELKAVADVPPDVAVRDGDRPGRRVGGRRRAPVDLARRAQPRGDRDGRPPARPTGRSMPPTSPNGTG